MNVGRAIENEVLDIFAERICRGTNNEVCASIEAVLLDHIIDSNEVGIVPFSTYHEIGTATATASDGICSCIPRESGPCGKGECEILDRCASAD